MPSQPLELYLSCLESKGHRVKLRAIVAQQLCEVLLAAAPFLRLLAFAGTHVDFQPLGQVADRFTHFQRLLALSLHVR